MNTFEKNFGHRLLKKVAANEIVLFRVKNSRHERGAPGGAPRSCREFFTLTALSGGLHAAMCLPCHLLRAYTRALSQFRVIRWHGGTQGTSKNVGKISDFRVILETDFFRAGLPLRPFDSGERCPGMDIWPRYDT